jgi:hypothetical protein
MVLALRIGVAAGDKPTNSMLAAGESQIVGACLPQAVLCRMIARHFNGPGNRYEEVSW